jgi:hypothetical protein
MNFMRFPLGLLGGLQRRSLRGKDARSRTWSADRDGAGGGDRRGRRAQVLRGGDGAVGRAHNEPPFCLFTAIQDTSVFS